MIDKELQKIVNDERSKGVSDNYIRNALKEYLQTYCLSYIYTTKKYNKELIFTGDTCLRFFFNLPRLSEDLDFDYQKIFNSNNLIDDIELYFKKRLQYKKIKISLKQRGQQILLKFPVLQKLGLAKANESNLLYVKLDLSKNSSKFFNLETTSKSIYGLNFVAKHYDLASLMSGKIHAVLKRNQLSGVNDIKTIKGRDYFDLLWFIKKYIKPNLDRLSEMLGEQIEMKILEERLDTKVRKLNLIYKSNFKADIIPLIENPDFISIYVDNYYKEYMRFKSYIFEK